MPRDSQLDQQTAHAHDTDKRALSAWIGVIAAISAVAAGTWFYLRPAPAEQFSGPPEPLLLAVSQKYIGSGLIHIAASKGYFTDAGVTVTLQMHTSGLSALASALDGKADLATTAETPLMFAALRGQPISIVATICNSGREFGIAARKDRGIATIADLRKKRVATTFGTTASYVLSTLLITSRVPFEDVTLVNLKPEHLAGALARGEVDAVSAWDPYLGEAIRSIGDNAVKFSTEGLYRATFNLAGRRDYVEQRPKAVRRLLRALARAEQFAQSHPDEAKAILASATGIGKTDIESNWTSYELKLSLDQRLITLLESESRWAIQGGMATGTEVPNFLDSVALEAMALIKPDAVSIIR